MKTLCPHCKGTVTGRRGHDPLTDHYRLGCPGMPAAKKKEEEEES